MKKYIQSISSLVLALAISVGAMAQTAVVIESEDFNGATIPTDWVTFGNDPVDPLASSQVLSDGWDFGVTSYAGFWTVPASPTGDEFAISNDDIVDEDKSLDFLGSPLLDLAGYDSLTLTFDLFLDEAFGSTGTLILSNNVNFTDAVSFPLPAFSDWNQGVNLTVTNGQELLAGIPFTFTDEVIIGFIHDDALDWGSGMAVDNFELEGFLPVCEATGTQVPASAIAAVGGQTTTISTSQNTSGEFSVVTNIVGSTEYVIAHSGGAYATVRTGSASGPILDAGFTPLTIATLSTDDLYLIWTDDEFCSTGAGTGTHVSSITGGAQVCAADAGTLTFGSNPNACLGDELIALVDDAPTVPAGYTVAYVITDGAGNIVDGPFANPTYTPAAEGTFVIHTMVYDPADEQTILGTVVSTQGDAVAVANLFEENGGQLCGSLDLAGVSFTVVDCPDNNDCEDATSLTCGDVVAGTNVDATEEFTGFGGNVWYTFQGNGQDVTFSNCSDGDFDSFFGLFTGDCNTLNQVAGNDDGTGCAGFTSELTWYAHPDTLYYLTVAGLTPAEVGTFNLTVSCACPAGLSEGSLAAAADVVCLDQNGEAALSATEVTAPGVPEGYGITYVLTSNPGLIIEDVNSTPDFTVSASGEYTIHTLVSANTLDLGVVDLGVTPASAVLGIVGGDDNICAALDVTGAPIEVPGAGTLTADATPVCLDGNGEAVISATHGDVPYVPTGYEVSYALTMGANLTIMQAGTNPEFTVDVEGDYTIHTLVHESSFDPLSVITPGVTTGGQVNALLVQGGGAVCAALDVPGAPIVVEACIVGIQDLAEGTLAVYPNPSNGEFVVEIDGVEAMAQINVTDLAGKVIFTEGAALNGNFRKEFNLDVVSGTYLLQVITEEGTVTRKLQVK